MKNRCLLSAVALLSGLMYARDYEPPANQGLVIHEWGTFTSVQGSDGFPMVWNPFETDELPGFVYDRSRPLTHISTGQPATIPNDQLIPSKSRSAWKQRMETPVIYAYSNEEVVFDVRVDFPSGEITEWYPQVSAFGPSVAHLENQRIERDSFVHWKEVTVEPKEDIQDCPLPLESPANHYYEARAVDANVLTVKKGLSASFKPQKEKFLFYRGVGNFSTPLNVRFDSPKSLVLHNSGKTELPFLLFLEVREGKAAFQIHSKLESKSNKRMTIAPKATFREAHKVAPELGQILVDALVRNGLYEKEAKSMVATWKSSWLTESGSRVLYILPRIWTDKVLPIRLNPTPKELERVMVGRAELITPHMEAELQSLFVQLDHGKLSHETTVSRIARMDLGRFTEPALTRLQNLRYRNISQQVQSLKHGTRVNVAKQPHAQQITASRIAP